MGRSLPWYSRSWLRMPLLAREAAPDYTLDHSASSERSQSVQSDPGAHATLPLSVHLASSARMRFPLAWNLGSHLSRASPWRASALQLKLGAEDCPEDFLRLKRVQHAALSLLLRSIPDKTPCGMKALTVDDLLNLPPAYGITPEVVEYVDFVRATPLWQPIFETPDCLLPQYGPEMKQAYMQAYVNFYYNS